MATSDRVDLADDSRQRRLLDAALATFARYGYRKTSMEEVARAAHVSRQGLYLHFPTKEELFRAVIDYAASTGLALAAERLRDQSLAIEHKLVAAFDQWTGRYIGIVGDNIADLHEATALVGAKVIAAYEERFVELVTKAIRASKLPMAFKPSGITARQLAETLQAVARGLKHSCDSRDSFVTRFAIAARALCVPAA